MFTNLTKPNIKDYLSFLYGVVGIPLENMPSSSGTATGGSAMTLTDTMQSWVVNQFAPPLVYDCVDTGSGQVAGILSNTANTLTFSSALQPPVAAGDGYIVIPDIVQMSLAVALDIVNDTLAMVSSLTYLLAVYNLAADRLINFASDDSIVPDQSYFEDLRQKLRISEVSTGVVSSTSNETSSTGLLNPEAMKTLTLQDLQTLKTPYGRTYMGFAQAYGPNIWGLT